MWFSMKILSFSMAFPPTAIRRRTSPPLPHLLFEKGDQQVVLVPEVQVDGPSATSAARAISVTFELKNPCREKIFTAARRIRSRFSPPLFGPLLAIAPSPRE